LWKSLFLHRLRATFLKLEEGWSGVILNVK
jgi:hypothetical protein